MRLGTAATQAWLALLLAGCVPMTAGNGPYAGMPMVKVGAQMLQPAQALAAIRRQNQAIIAQIKPEPAPLADSVRIVLADHDRMRPLTMQARPGLVGGQLEFLTEAGLMGEQSFAEVIRQSHLFRTVTVVEQNDTVAPDPGGAEYLLWYRVSSIRPNNAGPWVGAWLLRKANAQTAASVGADPGTPMGLPRMASIVRSVRSALTGQTTPGVVVGSAIHPIKTGSGVVIDAQGRVLTDDHVVAGCSDLRVVDAANQSMPVTLAASDAANDLALLETHHHWPAWASFRDSASLRAGEAVVVTGFPLTGLVSPEMAVTTGSITALAGLRGDSRQFEFSAPVQPGNSGGPVLDESGRVVGVSVAVLNPLATAASGAMAQNVNFAIKTATIRVFLDANHAAAEAGAGHPGLSVPGVADLARRFTVKVECWH